MMGVLVAEKEKWLILEPQRGSDLSTAVLISRIRHPKLPLYCTLYILNIERRASDED